MIALASLALMRFLNSWAPRRLQRQALLFVVMICGAVRAWTTTQHQHRHSQRLLGGILSRSMLHTHQDRASSSLAAASKTASTAASGDDSSTEKRNGVWDVHRYQKQHSFVWEYGSSVVDLVQMESGLRVLDVGCGSGELTKLLSEKAPETTCIGIDADANMISQAQEQYPDMQFRVADISDIDALIPDIGVKPESVDVVFSNACLHWIPADRIENAVATMSKLLKPGGQLVVEFGGKGNVDAIFQAVRQVVNDDSRIENWYFPSISEFTSILEEQGGIEVTMAQLFDRPTLLQDGEQGIANWLRMFGVPKFFQNMNVTNGELDDILDKVTDITRPTLFSGEAFVADYRRIRVVGRKL